MIRLCVVTSSALTPTVIAGLATMTPMLSCKFILAIALTAVACADENIFVAA